MLESALAEGIEPVCAKTRYTHPVKGVTFGMTKNQVQAVLAKNYPSSNYTLDKNSDVLWFLEFKDESTFDKYCFDFVEGRLTQIKISYSDSFQNKFGGTSSAVGAVIKAVIEKYGQTDRSLYEKIDIQGDEVHKVSWPEDGGGRLMFVAVSSANMILVGYSCVEFENHLLEVRRKKTNFGL